MKKIWNKKALSYDYKFNSGVISKYIQSLNFKIMMKYFNQIKGNTLLDLGCGTGREAINFAKNGFKVLGIDISSEMIDISIKKSSRSIYQRNLFFMELPIEKIDSLTNLKFSGIYSSFGPLNCINNLTDFAHNISNLLLPGGFFICSMVNKFFLSEIIYYLIRLKPKRIIKRWLGNPPFVNLSTLYPKFPCNFYTPREFFDFFKSDFYLENLIGFPILIPPIDIKDKNTVFSEIVKKLIRIEMKINYFPFFRGIGDHFIIIMRKK